LPSRMVCRVCAQMDAAFALISASASCVLHTSLERHAQWPSYALLCSRRPLARHPTLARGRPPSAIIVPEGASVASSKTRAADRNLERGRGSHRPMKWSRANADE
jgi:hypothetical protein